MYQDVNNLLHLKFTRKFACQINRGKRERTDQYD